MLRVMAGVTLGLLAVVAVVGVLAEDHEEGSLPWQIWRTATRSERRTAVIKTIAMAIFVVALVVGYLVLFAVLDPGPR
jgi:hypothetical protein